MMPLTVGKAGDELTVVKVGGNEEMKQHLADLGFVPDAVVTVVSATGDGNVIVNVKGARLALTEQMAQKVMVL